MYATSTYIVICNTVHNHFSLNKECVPKITFHDTAVTSKALSTSHLSQQSFPIGKHFILSIVFFF